LCIIKLVDKKYVTNESVYNVCRYVLDCLKTTEDLYRGIGKQDNFSNMSYIGPQWVPEACANGIAEEIMLQNHLYHNIDITQVYHRVIAFEYDDLVNGNDLKSLMDYIMTTIYSDYTWTYGIHMDTKNIHVHILVSAISRHWRRFNISYEVERLYSICCNWYEKHCDYIMRTGKLERYI